MRLWRHGLLLLLLVLLLLVLLSLLLPLLLLLLLLAICRCLLKRGAQLRLGGIKERVLRGPPGAPRCKGKQESA